MSLGRFRRPINIFALAFAAVTTVAFLFPPGLPVTGSSMNYVIVIAVIACLLSVATWFTDGKKHFQGPTDMEARLQEAAGSSTGEA